MSQMRHYLEFEKSISDLETKIAELEALAKSDDGPEIGDELGRLEAKAQKLLKDTYANLDAWKKTQVARHPARPHASDYINGLISDFQELAGDRLYSDDAALIAGLGRFRGRPVAVLGQEKGRTTQTRLARNFGMAHPEGYRKAIRLMDLAERFGLPVLGFVDTAGAYPGKGAEERGQAEAIARSTERCLSLGVPMVSTIIGEGGSGGAVALASANKVLMLEHSIYSVISPEGCASILWRDAKKAPDAAEAMKVTGKDLVKFRIVDAIVPEPLGGAHRDPEAAISAVGDQIGTLLEALSSSSPDQLRHQRRERFLRIGRDLAS